MSDTQDGSNTGSSSQIVIDGRIVQSGRCNGVASGNIVPSVGDIPSITPHGSDAINVIKTNYNFESAYFDRWVQ